MEAALVSILDGKIFFAFGKELATVFKLLQGFFSCYLMYFPFGSGRIWMGISSPKGPQCDIPRRLIDFGVTGQIRGTSVNMLWFLRTDTRWAIYMVSGEFRVSDVW